MYCPNCGIEYLPGETCRCASGITLPSANETGRELTTKSQSPGLQYPGETDAFCSLSVDPGRGGIP